MVDLQPSAHQLGGMMQACDGSMTRPIVYVGLGAAPLAVLASGLEQWVSDE